MVLLLLPLPDLAAGDDEDVGVFLRGAGLLALAGGLAPLALRAAETTTLTTFAAAVRMINGVHRGAADHRVHRVAVALRGGGVERVVGGHAAVFANTHHLAMVGVQALVIVFGMLWNLEPNAWEIKALPITVFAWALYQHLYWNVYYVRSRHQQ